MCGAHVGSMVGSRIWGTGQLILEIRLQEQVGFHGKCEAWRAGTSTARGLGRVGPWAQAGGLGSLRTPQPVESGHVAEVGHAADRLRSPPAGDEGEEDQYTGPEKPLCPAVTRQHPLLMKTHVAPILRVLPVTPGQLPERGRAGRDRLMRGTMLRTSSTAVVLATLRW